MFDGCERFIPYRWEPPPRFMPARRCFWRGLALWFMAGGATLLVSTIFPPLVIFALVILLGCPFLALKSRRGQCPSCKHEILLMSGSSTKCRGCGSRIVYNKRNEVFSLARPRGE